MLIGIATGITAQSAPFILGQATVGNTLSLSPVTLTGSGPFTYSVQWLRNDSPISGATAATYTILEADVGSELTAALTLPDSTTLTSRNSVRIEEPVEYVPPAITGAASVTVEDLGDTVRYNFSEPSVAGTTPITITPSLTLDGVNVTGDMVAMSYTAAKIASSQTLVMTFTALNGVSPNATSTVTRTVSAAAAGDVAPTFTAQPSIFPASGAVGTTFTLLEGTATGTPAPTLSGVLTLNGVNVTADMTGLSYVSDSEGDLVWTVTASNGTAPNASASVSGAVAAPSGLVDLAAATSSMRFPPGNSLAAGTPDRLSLTLSQDTTGLPRLFINNKSHGGWMALVRLPVASRRTDAPDTNNYYYLTGDDEHYIRVNSSTFQFRDYQYETSVTVPWETALIVAIRYTDVDLASNRTIQIIAVNPETGEVLQGNKNTQTRSAADWGGDYRIGSTAPGIAAAPEQWPGEIAWIAQIEGPLRSRLALGATDQLSYIKRIAAGEDIQDVLYDIEVQDDAWTRDDGPFLTYYRDFDGTAASLASSHVEAKPVPPENVSDGNVGLALRDTSATTTLVAGTVKPGTDFAYRNGNLLTWKTVGVPGMATPPAIAPGYVRGLVPGETAADVEFAGTVVGYTGTVEIRLIYQDTGAVALDWTTVGTITDGAWSGTVTVPKSVDGWLVTQFRIGGEIWNHRDIWGVGYRALQLGQSQTKIYLGGEGGLSTMDTDNMGTVSRVSGERIYLMGPRGLNDAMNAFVDQLRLLEPKVPVMLTQDVVNGTSQGWLIDDSDARRDWAPLQALLDFWGNDVSVVLKNWVTNEMALSPTAYTDVLNGMIKGTGAGAADHDFDTALQPGYVFAFSPATRHVGLPSGADHQSSYAGNAEEVRTLEADYAQTEAATNSGGLPDMIVGLPVSDFEIEDAGGPHQQVAGSMVFGARMAMTLVKAVGGTVPAQPYFTGSATLAPGGGSITIPVTLTNGGTLTALAPTAIRSFGVSADGGSSWTTQGFTAAISGSNVVLTKDSGTWSAGSLQVRHYSNGEDRVDGDAAAEKAILRGMLYETTPQALPVPLITSAPTDMTQGVPVMGEMSGSQWHPDFRATVTAE